MLEFTTTSPNKDGLRFDFLFSWVRVVWGSLVYFSFWDCIQQSLKMTSLVRFSLNNISTSTRTTAKTQFSNDVCFKIYCNKTHVKVEILWIFSTPSIYSVNQKKNREQKCWYKANWLYISHTSLEPKIPSISSKHVVLGLRHFSAECTFLEKRIRHPK